MPSPRIITMGRGGAESYVPGRDEVCISIHSTGDHRPTLSAGFREVLQLAFNDGGCLVDDITSVDTTDSIDDVQAAQIAAFVERHRDARKLIVHCFAGASRSVAVARAIARIRGWPIECPVDRILNQHVYQAVVRALRAGSASPQPGGA